MTAAPTHLADLDELVSTRPVSIVALPVEEAATAAPSPRPRGSRLVVVASLLGLAGLLGVATVALRGGAFHADAPASAPAKTTTSLELRSQPTGASIFVDGRPTGLRTPAVLTGLPVGQTVMVRLDLAGYVAASKEVPLTSDQPQTVSFALGADRSTP